ncbi:alpha-1,2-fucosyltransferase [Bacteriovoracales bacterium]|nr:alpha-1,2-fucosyltransferase [Bacteriovoracales bacterium]
MIIVRLYGGLGNQLFQYSFGYSLAKKLNQDFLIDIGEFEVLSKNTKRRYGLKNYKISSKTLSSQNIKNYKIAKISPLYKVLRKSLNYLPLGTLGYFREKASEYQPNIQGNRSSGYFDGYWQSFKYFNDFRKDLTKEFVPKEFNQQNNQLKNEILKTNSVSLHIRRGDFVSDKETNKFHGLCSLDYYYRAIKDLESQDNNLFFYVFSDEPKWAKKSLKIDFPTQIVDINGERNPENDLHLMSHCKHHIIANSTFSWWGAWLAERKGKRVYAPKFWTSKKRATEDLILPLWKVI